jgi:hypothetical protein
LNKPFESSIVPSYLDGFSIGTISVVSLLSPCDAAAKRIQRAGLPVLTVEVAFIGLGDVIRPLA